MIRLVRCCAVPGLHDVPAILRGYPARARRAEYRLDGGRENENERKEVGAMEDKTREKGEPREKPSGDESAGNETTRTDETIERTTETEKPSRDDDGGE